MNGWMIILSFFPSVFFCLSNVVGLEENYLRAHGVERKYISYSSVNPWESVLFICLNHLGWLLSKQRFYPQAKGHSLSKPWSVSRCHLIYGWNFLLQQTRPQSVHPAVTNNLTLTSRWGRDPPSFWLTAILIFSFSIFYQSIRIYFTFFQTWGVVKNWMKQN